LGDWGDAIKIEYGRKRRNTRNEIVFKKLETGSMDEKLGALRINWFHDIGTSVHCIITACLVLDGHSP
jgi:hypothetical protein